MTTFDANTIAASLYAHWADQFPLVVPTIHPGTEIDLTEAVEWIDLAIESWSERARRETGKRMLNVGVAAHCFVKPSVDHGRVDVLAEAARVTLAPRIIAVRDWHSSGQPVTGYLKLFEPQARDLSRPARAGESATLRHVAIRVVGIAEED